MTWIRGQGYDPYIRPDDPRLKGKETDYQASRGGWFPREKKPTPGTPKK